VFAIQSDVAQNVAQALQITLNPAEKRQIEKAGTDDLEAYNAYLQGLYHYNTWSQEGLEKSVDYFEQAIARDPAFAKAYAAMAFAYDLLGEYGYLPPDEAVTKMKDAAHRTLEIDATTAEAHTALAVAASYYDYDWVRADAGFRRALELNPNSAGTHDWYGIIFLSPTGRHDEGINHGKRAKELDPLTAYIRSDLGWSYNLARRWDEAIAECEQIPDIDPNFSFGYWCLGMAYWQKGMLDEAVAAYERAVDLAPDHWQVKSELALAYATAGKNVQAQSILEELEEQGRQGYVTPAALALAHLAVGDLDGTFRWLDNLEERSPQLIWMNTNAAYDPLRGDPRFKELMRKVGFEEPKLLPEVGSD